MLVLSAALAADDCGCVSNGFAEADLDKDCRLGRQEMEDYLEKQNDVRHSWLQEVYESANCDGDPFVSWDEFYEYAFEHVRCDSQEDVGLPQTRRDIP